MRKKLFFPEHKNQYLFYHLSSQKSSLENVGNKPSSKEILPQQKCLNYTYTGARTPSKERAAVEVGREKIVTAAACAQLSPPSHPPFLALCERVRERERERPGYYPRASKYGGARIVLALRSLLASTRQPRVLRRAFSACRKPSLAIKDAFRRRATATPEMSALFFLFAWRYSICTTDYRLEKN